MRKINDEYGTYLGKNNSARNTKIKEETHTALRMCLFTCSCFPRVFFLELSDHQQARFALLAIANSDKKTKIRRVCDIFLFVSLFSLLRNFKTQKSRWHNWGCCVLQLFRRSYALPAFLFFFGSFLVASFFFSTPMVRRSGRFCLNSLYANEY